MSEDGRDGRSTLARGEAASERRPGLRPAGLASTRIVGPIVAQHGGSVLARLKADWPAIVGAELALTTWPEAFARGGTLRLRVAPTAAIAIQHRAPQVMERINLFFGRDAVARLALVQGPLPLPAPAMRAPPRPLARTEQTTLDRQLDGIADPELRAALGRLGRSIIVTTEP